MINVPLLVSKLRSRHIREYRHEDFETCVSIYRSNLPDLLPPDILPDFENFLREGCSYILIVECDGQVVGTGSLALQGDSSNSHLAYGMIHRAHHGKGFGASLLAARLSLSDPSSWPTQVHLETSPFSGNFFAQFGFRIVATHEGYNLGNDETGTTKMPFAHWHLSLVEEDVLSLRTALLEKGVELNLETESMFADQSYETQAPQ